MKRLYKLKTPVLHMFLKDKDINLYPPKYKFCELLAGSEILSRSYLSEILSNNKENFSVSEEYINSLNEDEILQLQSAVTVFLEKILLMPEIKTPYANTDKANTNTYEVTTFPEKIVSDYTGITMYEVQELNTYEFMLLLREARIYSLMQSEGGQKYLEDCFIYEQTEPDRAGLRELAAAAGKNK